MKGIIRLKITDLLLFKKNSNKQITCKKCTYDLHLFANGFETFLQHTEDLEKLSEYK
jgi:hypothetical protein